MTQRRRFGEGALFWTFGFEAMSSRRTEILKSRAQRRVLARKSCQEMDGSLGSGGHGKAKGNSRKQDEDHRLSPETLTATLGVQAAEQE